MKRIWKLIDPSHTYRKSSNKSSSKSNDKKSSSEVSAQSSNSAAHNTSDLQNKQSKSSSCKKRKLSLENPKLAKMRKRDSNSEYLSLHNTAAKSNSGLEDCSSTPKSKLLHSSSSFISMPTEDELNDKDISNSSW